MRHYPALGLSWPRPPTDDEIDGALAAIDDCHPTAVEPRRGGVCVYFATVVDRDDAERVLRTASGEIMRERLLVPDDGWAERSQASLAPVRVDRIVVSPPWAAVDHADDRTTVRVVIQPSIGFGTGHHASTRLCLRLLQRHVTGGSSVVDVGTGSGVLAIAAALLGATRVVAIDTDADALANAEENIALSGASGIELQQIDLADVGSAPGALADVVTANLTGALISRSVPALLAALAPGGVAIVSGFEQSERDAVRAALEAGGGRLSEAVEEDGWVGLAVRVGG